MRERPRLARRPEDGMIAGVAAGVAETYGIDVTLVRLVFVATAVLTGGVAVAVYLVAAVLMPREDDTPGIGSLKNSMNDLVSRGRSLYDEGRKAIDRTPAGGSAETPDLDARVANAPTGSTPTDRPPV